MLEHLLVLILVRGNPIDRCCRAVRRGTDGFNRRPVILAEGFPHGQCDGRPLPKQGVVALIGIDEIEAGHWLFVQEHRQSARQACGRLVRFADPSFSLRSPCFDRSAPPIMLPLRKSSFRPSAREQHADRAQHQYRQSPAPRLDQSIDPEIWPPSRALSWLGNVWSCRVAIDRRIGESFQSSMPNNIVSPVRAS